MRENFKQAIDVSVPFAFWTFIFSLVFGALAGSIFGILELWGRFSGLVDAILAALFYMPWGAYFGFLTFLFIGVPTACVFGLLTLFRPQYFRQLSYIISFIALIIIFFIWWLPTSPTESWLIRIELELYMHWAAFVVLALSLFGAATRITLKRPVQKPKAKRGE